jgi:hypothetical protein
MREDGTVAPRGSRKSTFKIRGDTLVTGGNMFCCVGLIAGAAVGQSLGGSWTLIAPAAGFGIGLVADMKFMHGHVKKTDQGDTGPRPQQNANPVGRTGVVESKARHAVQHMAKT